MIDLFYQDSKGSAPTVIFIHGNSFNSHSFDLQLHDQCLREFRFITFDLPGHGKSPAPVNPAQIYSLKGYASILINFINQLNLKEYVIVGHSMGGHIAMEALPQLKGLKGLVLFGAPPVDGLQDMEQLFADSEINKLIFQELWETHEMEIFVNGMIKDQRYRDKALSWAQQTDPKSRKLLGESIARAEFNPEFQAIQHSKVPILPILCPKDDGFNLEALQNRLDQCGQVKTIAGAGHTPQIDNHEEFNSILLEFLQQIYSD